MSKKVTTASRGFASVSQKSALLAVILMAGTVTSVAAESDPTSLQAWDYWQSPASPEQEEYVASKMPAGFQVVVTELEGPVFADANGRTLYKWPLENLRNGSTGDRKDGKSECTDEVLTVTSGLMSPYPAGLVLPNIDQRPSCVEVWPPVIAAEGAEPVGDWKLVERSDGSMQWAYDGYPMYVSILDQKKGDTLGGTKIESGGDAPAVRVPVGPRSAHPPIFEVIPMATGRMLITEDRYSVYSWDGDEPNKSNCFDSCLDNWTPVMAPETAVGQGKWTVIERSPGVGQWAFRGKPLYTYNNDPRTISLIGSDVPGWNNVYTQRVMLPPEDFTVQSTRIGHVLADADGKTLYLYNCSDDAFDQLACDHPDTPQEYRLAICGNGDPEICRNTFPYVPAPTDASSESGLWSVMIINPNTGHRASEDEEGAMHVWAYRDRPVYTFTGDEVPGDANGDAYGEFNGYRNGFKAFWLRDDYMSNAYSR